MTRENEPKPPADGRSDSPHCTWISAALLSGTRQKLTGVWGVKVPLRRPYRPISQRTEPKP